MSNLSCFFFLIIFLSTQDKHFCHIFFSKSITLQGTLYDSFEDILSLISQKESSEVVCPLCRKLGFRESYIVSSDDLTSKQKR